jgi:hypothetical protein
VLFMLALVCALMLGGGAGAAVAVAAGSTNPLSGGVTAPATPTPTTATQTATSPTTTTAAGGGSLGKSSLIAIVVGAVIVIGGVCTYIFRDASRRAPSRKRADAGPNRERRVPGSQRVNPRKLSTQERRRRKRGRAPRRK